MGEVARCLQCGKFIKQGKIGRPRKFCDNNDRCSNLWHIHKHRAKMRAERKRHREIEWVEEIREADRKAYMEMGGGKYG